MGIHDTIENRLTRMAGAMALTVPFVLATAYFVVSHSSQMASLSTESEINARLITTLINDNPELWRFEILRLEQMLARRPGDRTPETRRVIHGDGSEVARSEDNFSLPYLAARHPVFDAGVQVGEIEITRSLTPLLIGTGLTALFGSLLGMAIFVLVKVLPVRAMRRLSEELERENNQLLAAQHAARAAEDASRLKTTFLTTMSHELRTPMNGMLGFVALALDEIQEETQDETLRMYLQEASNSGQDLLRIVEDILDYSKAEAGKIEMRAAPMSLFNTLESVCLRLEPAASAKGLQLLRSIDPTIPTTLMGDKARIVQVMNNLVGNAVKFTERGSVRMEARLLERTANTVRVSIAVADTGIGIAAAQLDRIFEPFSQADGSLTRKYGGTGLGLAITHRLVELMEGGIEVYSEAGAGSTFTVFLSLPVFVEEAPEAAA